jgi:hypothetical protein
MRHRTGENEIMSESQPFLVFVSRPGRSLAKKTHKDTGGVPDDNTKLANQNNRGLAAKV